MSECPWARDCSRLGIRSMAAFNIVPVAVWLLLAAGVICEH